MKTNRPGAPGAARRLLCLMLPLGVAACSPPAEQHYQGYVEGDYVYVASSFGGTLQELSVKEGLQVEQGAPLFRLDANPEALRVAETRGRLAQAEARRADLEKGLRPSELATLEARLARARAALELARRDHARRSELYEAGETDAVSEEELDRFRTDVETRSFEVASLEAELETARLGGRADALEAARGEVDTVEATMRELEWQIGEKDVAAPVAGLVQDTLYRVGEYVAPGRPVVVLLPPENLEIRFFVPQAALPTIQRGDLVQVVADGIDGRLRASISFISSEAEFTPPVIYSKDSRGKLVFQVEARPDAASLGRLRPGQPLEVLLD